MHLTFELNKTIEKRELNRDILVKYTNSADFSDNNSTSREEVHFLAVSHKYPYTTPKCPCNQLKKKHGSHVNSGRIEGI